MADRQTLTPFIIGLHRRGEDWTAHDLGLLLDELGMPVADKDDVVAYVNDALVLLDAYDRAVDDDELGEDVPDVGDEERPGWLVI